MKQLILGIALIQLSTIGCHTQSRGSSAIDQAPFRAIHLPAGLHPTMLTIADVNKDGNPDILVVSGGSGHLFVYLGDGKGNFAQSGGTPFAAGPEPNDIATGDFNGDGNLDVAIANHGVKTVTVLLGNGKGQFALAPGSPFAVESRPHPHGIAVADFNGDRKPDIAVDSWGENKVLVMFGKGDGTFQSPGVKFDVGKMPYQRLRTAVLSEPPAARGPREGIPSGVQDAGGPNSAPDIITSNFESSSVSVLSGDGHGNFTRKDFPVPPDPFGIAIADLNGDHHLDIAIGHYSGQGTDPSKNALSVLYGDGKGNFTLAKGSPFPTGHYPGTLAVGDLNGDGIADIVVPNYEDGTLTIYLCRANGITLAPYSPIHVGHTPHGVAIADLNHDGKGDIVVAEEEDNDVLVLLSK
jgi:hypothetical protein